MSQTTAPVIDSHCHLQSLSADDCQKALDEARGAGVTGFLVPAIQLEESTAILELCHRHDDVWCALGVHPHEASSWRAGDQRRLADLLSDPRAVAVGECGLDYHYELSPPEAQQRALREQWELAIQLDLPVVVHNRESDGEMLTEVRRQEMAELRGDFHSFSGSLKMAAELLEQGFYLGVSGMVTFRKADNIREILDLIPLNRLLLETDTPYLAPVPHRGKPNRPAYVREVARRAAQERTVSLEELARAANRNFFRLFDKALSD